MRYALFSGALGVVYLALGLAVLFNPLESAEAVSLEASSAAGRMEFLAVYGGLEIALGLWWLLAALRTHRLLQALQLSVLVHAALSLTRLAGLLQWPDPDAWTVLVFTSEILVAVLSGFLLRSYLADHPEKHWLSAA